MIDPTDLPDLLAERERHWKDRHAAMAEIARVYTGDADVPLPELGKNERPAVANLIRQGLDQEAMRVASPTPTLQVPAVRTGDAAARRAKRRRAAWLGAWERNDLGSAMRLRARHLLGFAVAPTVLLPDDGLAGARWEVIDPRMAYGPPHCRPGEVVPDDFVWVVERSMGWLQRAYPDQWRSLRRDGDSPDTKVRCVCHVDSDAVTMICCRESHDRATGGTRVYAEVLRRFENRAGRPLVTAPTAITLDRAQSTFEGMLGMYQTRALLMALQIHAVRRGVFRDWWLEEDPQGNRAARIVEEPDPYLGRPGIVQGGRLVPDQVDPQFATNTLIDKIEYGERMSGSIPPDFGGASSTNVRTGRRAQQLLSTTIDFYIEEAQHLLARALQAECEISAEIEQGWFGNVEKSFYVNAKGAKGFVEYRPAELWGESTECRVSYAMSGSDVDSLVIGAGQRVGMDAMSRRSFMELDPMVEDPEYEADRIKFERLESAFLASIEQQAGSGEGTFADPVLLGRLARMVAEDRRELFEAVDELNREVQAEQEAAAQAAAEGQMAAPPGLSPEGSALVPSIAPAEESIPGMRNLAGVLAAGRLPQMRTPVEA